MKKLLNKSMHAYYLVILYFVTFATILIMTSSCTVATYASKHHVDRCPDWANCVLNPANEEYVEEIAFNLNIKPIEVTQEQFNSRYND
jgi:hypothetical protein